MTRITDLLNTAAPCGIYCGACPCFRELQTCTGCRTDVRHNNCEIYDCCVKIGGKQFCHECELFPCERLQKFSSYHPGEKFAHYRHVTIQNLYLLKEKGLEQWHTIMKQRTDEGSYTIYCRNMDGSPDRSPCQCNSVTEKRGFLIDEQE